MTVTEVLLYAAAPAITTAMSMMLAFLGWTWLDGWVIARRLRAEDLARRVAEMAKIPEPPDDDDEVAWRRHRQAEIDAISACTRPLHPLPRLRIDVDPNDAKPPGEVAP